MAAGLMHRFRPKSATLSILAARQWLGRVSIGLVSENNNKDLDSLVILMLYAGSGETMVPEGVEWTSVEGILDLVKSVGFNFIRLTYAIEMVDQIYERNGSDVPLEVAMITALGYENGTKVTNEIVAKNEGFSKDTGRFEVWDRIAEAALERGIYIHPDVHVGKAQWCCNNT